MSHFHAVVWIDHQTAKILQFDADGVESQQIHAHKHDTRHHNSTVRTEHEFFGQVCDHLTQISEVVVTGSHTALADFRHYVTKHRAAIVSRIVGWEVVDHPTDAQLVAFAKKYFLKYDQMAGTRVIPSAPDSAGALPK